MAKSEGAINRKRKNSFERKCLSKKYKRQFSGSSKEIFRMIDKVEKVAKKLESAVMGYDVKAKDSRSK